MRFLEMLAIGFLIREYQTTDVATEFLEFRMVNGHVFRSLIEIVEGDLASRTFQHRCANFTAFSIDLFGDLLFGFLADFVADFRHLFLAVEFLLLHLDGAYLAHVARQSDIGAFGGFGRLEFEKRD